MVIGRVVKSPIPATGQYRGEGGDITDTCHMSLQGYGRREGGEIINTCYRSWQEAGWSNYHYLLHVMVGARVMKSPMLATCRGRREGGETTDIPNMLW